MLGAALTGDVGSGKSTVARVWRSMGIDVADCDEIARSMWSDPDVERVARERWGSDIYDDAGRPIYARIADRVFGEESERKFAGELLHPKVYRRLEREALGTRGLYAAEIPLLFEAGRPGWVGCTVYITAPLELRARRNVSRRWDEAEITRRERGLMSSESKIALSDEVLVNDGTREEWEARARELGRRLMRMADITESEVWWPDEASARRAAEMLVDRRLAASADILPTESRYRWDGRVHERLEWRLAFRSTEDARREACRAIKQTHPYELPAVISRELVGSDYATLSWIEKNCV